MPSSVLRPGYCLQRPLGLRMQGVCAVVCGQAAHSDLSLSSPVRCRHEGSGAWVVENQGDLALTVSVLGASAAELH